VGTLGATIQTASLPALDFAARWLLAKMAMLEEGHRETAGILAALRVRIGAERDASIEAERPATCAP
jgi:hypothetical protein